MSRKVSQIIARGERRWLVRVYLGRDHELRSREESVPWWARAAGLPYLDRGVLL
jgi:hypothetical protein